MDSGRGHYNGSVLSRGRSSRRFFEKKLTRGITSTTLNMMTGKYMCKCWYSLGNQSHYLMHLHFLSNPKRIQSISKTFVINFHFSLQFSAMHLLFFFPNKYRQTTSTISYKYIFPFLGSHDCIKFQPLTYFVYVNPELLEDRMLFYS